MDYIKVKIDEVDFTCYLSFPQVLVKREGLDFALWESNIISGNFDAPVYDRIDLELNSNLELYRKALHKVKTLKLFV